MTDWNSMAEEYKPKYKEYAKNGTYKVKLDEVEIHEVGQNGSIAQDFKFQDSEQYKFPKATHWLSFKNDKWRMWHNKCLFQLLGLSEDVAKKTVDSCEKGSKEDTVKAYSAAYAKLASKHPEVEIEVYPDGKWSRSDFTDGSVRMGKTEKKQSDPLDGAEPLEMDDFPF